MHVPDAERPAPGDVAVALSLLTRLPLNPGAADFTRATAAVWAYPLAGLAVAAIAGMISWAAQALGLPAPLAAGLSLAGLVVLTGAMHEDGLADSADGLWGGWDRARRLEIMKDSHTGSYGVIALILSLGARWMALSLLWQQGGAVAALIAAAALSRGAMPALMAALPHARADGLSRSVGRPTPRMAGLAALLAVGIAGLSIGPVEAITAALAAGLAAWAVARIARARIGGQTGDILGACQQCCEIAALWVLCA
ncbi:adenosylcobinamide-GDP ribazoletransferase [Sediminimonas sp.]|uniref:adenosylcobinamide-GDP ribazoletransferase n=1 Tax=Sediminimonas sp. TaxID=2823379 RepID=UPI0026004112|nr:adenosylcobinamide-GDP ribazoletransferase [Sediminimonas sp.]